MAAIPLLGNFARKIAAPAIVRASAYWTPKRLAKTQELQAPKRRVAANTLEALIENRNVVMLEPISARKYKRDLKRANYVLKKSMPLVTGNCDATGQFSQSCLFFIPKELESR